MRLRLQHQKWQPNQLKSQLSQQLRNRRRNHQSLRQNHQRHLIAQRIAYCPTKQVYMPIARTCAATYRAYAPTLCSIVPKWSATKATHFPSQVCVASNRICAVGKHHQSEWNYDFWTNANTDNPQRYTKNLSYLYELFIRFSFCSNCLLFLLFIFLRLLMIWNCAK